MKLADGRYDRYQRMLQGWLDEVYDKGYKQGFKDGVESEEHQELKLKLEEANKYYQQGYNARKAETTQNANDEIKIGDEVETNPEKEIGYARFVVCGIDKNRNLTGFSKDGHWSCWAEYYCRKTGRHFDQIEQVFEAMRENN